ncbi:MAG: hypothetical protein R3C12_05325 [Planctomycetaceae bacterium]
MTEGQDWLPASEMSRLLRPYGGVHSWEPRTGWNGTERGPLAGAGQWTHQYATAGNATCSTDELVKGPLGLLWFRDIDVEMPQRHGRGPGPLFYDGRLYSMGMHELACVDAYNGRLLWKYPLPDILKAYDGDELMNCGHAWQLLHGGIGSGRALEGTVYESIASRENCWESSTRRSLRMASRAHGGTWRVRMAYCWGLWQIPSTL